ncbi:MAG: hypothetical protein AB7N91_01840 [Candidatus Tectimicrobiota bacterium]
MVRRYVTTALLSGSLMFGLLTVFTPSSAQANGIGVYASVTSITPRGAATLVTEGGETFTTIAGSRWKVGSKLHCNRMTSARVYVENCQLWQ